ncbi:hypothetical protein [Demequina sp. NBRC 110054]|uniref:hypothetical protein n=1 Tax=Demequina sp. NBRC 110054 TaxID=1570343 RepID=UPI000A03523B|nr:hypothetical protein [Demequina sp. NBRC 110054]
MGGEGDGGSLFIALLLIASGPAAGWWTWRSIHKRYRNREARYRPDRSVAHTVSSLTGHDEPRGRFTTTESSTRDRNESEPDRRARDSRYFHGAIPSPPSPEDAGDTGQREGEAEPPPPPGTEPPPASSPPPPTR